MEFHDRILLTGRRRAADILSNACTHWRRLKGYSIGPPHPD
jgi:hypothetical protein